jgi:hypothetical protein
MSSAMSTVWYTLIFNSDVCDFWKETWLIIHVELIFVVCYIQLSGSYAVEAYILIFHRWNMSLTILSSIVLIICHHSITCK